MKPWLLRRVRVWAGPELGESGSCIAFDPASGTVLAAGHDEAEVSRAAGPAAEVVDGGGRWLVPGFVDAHLHVAAAAVAADGDCSGIRDGEGLLALVAERARSGSGWLSLHGLEHRRPDEGSLDLPLPARLEEAAGGRPVRIRHRTLHAWYLGPRAAAAVSQPSGWVMDPTGQIARRIPPARSEADLEAAVARLSRRLLTLGVTAVLDAGAANGPGEIARLGGWRRRGALLQDLRSLGSAGAAGAAGRKLIPRPGATAAELRHALGEARAEGGLVAVHCADLEALGALIEVAEAIGGCAGLRVEHGTVCPPEWIPRLAALGATVIAQPAFIVEHGARYARTAGPIPWLYRLRSWLLGGVGLAFGSDAPSGPPAPLDALRAAVDRRLADGRSFGAPEALTPGQALAALTAWAADASWLPGHGRLQAGAAGSAVLLAGDPWSGAGTVGIHRVVHRGRLAA